uniref:Uncharacterized protein n=2 Tax=Hucho hucho TaxID=62062 RepID=A0A4W5PVL3_9TELE
MDENNGCGEVDYLLQVEDSLIEGVSNPVLFVVVLSVTFLCGLVTLLCRNEQYNIHPENQEHVRAVRQQLQSESQVTTSDAVTVESQHLGTFWVMFIRHQMEDNVLRQRGTTWTSLIHFNKYFSLVCSNEQDPGIVSH